MRKGLMKQCMTGLTLSTLLAMSIQTIYAATHQVAPYTSTQMMLKNMTPAQALQRLMEGNNRFVHNQTIQRNLLSQAKVTGLKGQFPSAVILSCMDSRGSPELIFDQGLGDVFSVRVAGNVIDSDQLGGIEFATKAIGSKLVVVMGHTRCGAVKGACQGVKLGNLTQLLDKIQPAVQIIKNQSNGKVNCDDYHVIDNIAKQNVIDMMKNIEEQSSIIHDMAANKQIMIIGAMHYLETGKVVFFDENGNEIK